jgi:hypothetical protein
MLDLGWFQEADANKMAIEPLADEENFEPETLEAMRTAYRMARQPPQLQHAADAMADALAEAIIELAEAGETNPGLLCYNALRRLMH